MASLAPADHSPYGGGTNLNIPGTTPYGGAHLFIALKDGRAGWFIHEVTFDDTTDLLGTDLIPGHPGVVGLWLNSWTEGDEVARAGDGSSIATWATRTPT